MKAPLNDYLVKYLQNVKFYTLNLSSKLCLEMASQSNIKTKNVLVFIKDINLGNNYLNTIFPCMLETATRYGFILLGMMVTDTSYRIDKTPEEIDCYIWLHIFLSKWDSIWMNFLENYTRRPLNFEATQLMLHRKYLFLMMYNTKSFFNSGMWMSRDKISYIFAFVLQGIYNFQTFQFVPWEIFRLMTNLYILTM